MKSSPCINLTKDQLAEAGLSTEDVGRTVSFTLKELPDGGYELENTEAEPAGEEETMAEGEGEGLDVAERAVSAEDPQDSGVDETRIEALRVTGGRRLVGEVRLTGAKNSVLKLMAAAAMTGERFPGST